MKIKRDSIKDISVKKHSEKTPIFFSFEYLQENQAKKKDGKFLHDFILRLKKLSELGWDGINKSDKHSFGIEQISLNEFSIKNQVPILTDDVKKLTVFRATGDNRIFAGIRDGEVFHIILIEYTFGDIYHPHQQM
ncbi:MAG: hypothetical protein J6W06_05120 [Bacteroidales bacterium]|nr:hypothetical protein [Bacteroidales bacterium]